VGERAGPAKAVGVQAAVDVPGRGSRSWIRPRPGRLEALVIRMAALATGTVPGGERGRLVQEVQLGEPVRPPLRTPPALELHDAHQPVAALRPAGEVTTRVEQPTPVVGDTEARFHVDLETDDVPAEVARLVRLGAEEVSRGRTWVVLRDPAGLLLCVVPAESSDFPTRSRPLS
jgi:Glyoxalase-like domain